MNKNILCILLAVVFSGCEDQIKVHERPYPFVELKEISDINSSGVTLKAKVLTYGNSEIKEYGFVLGPNDKPTIKGRKITLKGKPANAFNLRIENDLLLEVLYFVRSYVKSENFLVYSNQKSFVSKGGYKPEIFTISPIVGSPGTYITIGGKYFSEYSANNTVKFNGISQDVIYSTNDTLIIRCPDIDAGPVDISVAVADNEDTLSNSFTVVSPWTRLSDFRGGSRYFSSYFTVGNKGYVTLGISAIGTSDLAPSDLWEYDLNTNQWTKKEPFPGELRSNTIDFTINGRGYIGLGRNSFYNSLYDLWQYNPITDTWVSKSAFPGIMNFTWIHAHFVLNDKLFFIPSTTTDLAVWTYDPVNNEWTRVYNEQLDYFKIYQEGFVYNNNGYFIETLYNNVNRKDGIVLWRYDDVLNEMHAEDTIFTGIRIEPCTFKIGNKLYISTRHEKLIEYNLDNGESFIYNHPSGKSTFNFRFIFGEKAILNNSETSKVYEFYTR